MILCDAGVLVAATNKSDRFHESSTALLKQHAGELLISPLVVAEVCYMIGHRAGIERKYGACREAAFLGSITLAGLTRL